MEMKYENVMYGADPELFLQNTDQQYVSAIGIIGGSKESPRVIDSDGSAVQEDNVAVEFNIPPAKTKHEFIHSIGKVMGYLHDFVSEKGFSLSVVPAVHFPDSELKHPKALQFGCDPDLNVWTRTVNESPDIATNLRSAGGHIHVSWDNPKDPAGELLVKALDIFVGAPSIAYDGDVLRRKLYGKAGTFRFKPYGIEYRTLSNFWIKSPDLVGWVFDQSEKAIDYLNSGGKIKKEHIPIIEDCINNGNEFSLEKLQQHYPI